MNRRRRWLSEWKSFLAGVCIGLLIVTPVLAAPISAEQLSEQLLQGLLVLGSLAILLVVLMLASIAMREPPRISRRQASSDRERPPRRNV
jgi:hypothetical protein